MKKNGHKFGDIPAIPTHVDNRHVRSPTSEKWEETQVAGLLSKVTPSLRKLQTGTRLVVIRAGGCAVQQSGNRFSSSSLNTAATKDTACFTPAVAIHRRCRPIQHNHRRPTSGLSSQDQVGCYRSLLKTKRQESRGT